ncbi:MAG: glycosyltransferase family 39 protein [Verrucomicrobiota bacterium]|nr:glycosyltransferase family 39 protein [Verrucomicrobiota bacterium]
MRRELFGVAVEAAGARRGASKYWLLGLLLPLLFLGASLCAELRVPWVENDNYCGAIYSQAAHNNLRAGLLKTAGVPATLYYGPLPIPREEFYVHHPTLFPLLITGAFATLGEAEWVARLVPILSSLGGLVFVWLIVRETAGGRAAAFSAALFAASPMELHYGGLVDFEPVLVLWMLATLFFLLRWEQTQRPHWRSLAIAGCLLCVLTDWPGYLFVGSLGAWYFFKRNPSRGFALLLVGLGGISAAIFLAQIRHINPRAWSDLWTAMTMRLGSGMATGSSGTETASNLHFTFVQWLQTVGGAIVRDFLPGPLLLAVAGGIILLLGRKRRELWAATHLSVAGFLYLIVLRNESFIHDFAAFYLLGAVAILGGVALDAAVRRSGKFASAATALALVLLVSLGAGAYGRSQSLRSQFYMLDGETPEPYNLVPAVGKYLYETFPPEATILANFDPYGSTMPYYAQRSIIQNLHEAENWRAVIKQESPPLGGIIWLGAPDAPELVASLPVAELVPQEIEHVRFLVWRPGS